MHLRGHNAAHVGVDVTIEPAERRRLIRWEAEKKRQEGDVAVSERCFRVLPRNRRIGRGKADKFRLHVRVLLDSSPPSPPPPPAAPDGLLPLFHEGEDDAGPRSPAAPCPPAFAGCASVGGGASLGSPHAPASERRVGSSEGGGACGEGEVLVEARSFECRVRQRSGKSRKKAAAAAPPAEVAAAAAAFSAAGEGGESRRCEC